MGNVELMDIIGKIQKEMEKIGKTDWIMNLDGDKCIFSIYFLEEEKYVLDNKKIAGFIKKIEKAFDVKGMSVGKTVTMCMERVEN